MKDKKILDLTVQGTGGNDGHQDNGERKADAPPPPALYLVSIVVDQELGLSPSIPVYVVLQDWIRHSDGKLSLLGFVKLLHGVSLHTILKA
ncbi:hypothetical protein ZIOFF_017148 [Zingiber officinale]|uniref:Uncharacterized protein n=1 Tax=Zingiber officinale TaxID=94328 RepID=A0A8J5HRG5_ZINOF|nr:hypothetical protein ZIOFF_017148 [Zingiber officinale]